MVTGQDKIYIFVPMKFNKHISILLTLLILASNMGFALNVHYCHDKVSSVTFAYKVNAPCAAVKVKKETKSCCAAAKETGKKCCKYHFVKLKSDKGDNVIVKSLQLNLGPFYAVNEWKPALPYADAPVFVSQTPSFYCEAHAPPLFKLYCQYIFYA